MENSEKNFFSWKSLTLFLVYLLNDAKMQRKKFRWWGYPHFRSRTLFCSATKLIFCISYSHYFSVKTSCLFRTIFVGMLKWTLFRTILMWKRGGGSDPFYTLFFLFVYLLNDAKMQRKIFIWGGRGTPNCGPEFRKFRKNFQMAPSLNICVICMHYTKLTSWPLLYWISPYFKVREARQYIFTISQSFVYSSSLNTGSFLRSSRNPAYFVQEYAKWWVERGGECWWWYIDLCEKPSQLLIVCH